MKQRWHNPGEMQRESLGKTAWIWAEAGRLQEEIKLRSWNRMNLPAAGGFEHTGGETMALSADILRGYTDTLILRRLAEGDSYGYQINKQITALSDGLAELKEATLYTAFRRMETAGYIRSYWGDENSGARRRYYAITDAGLEKLCQDCESWKETRQIIDRLLEGKA